MINNRVRTMVGLLVMLVVGAPALGCARLRAEPQEESYQGVAELKERVLAFEVGGRIVSLRVHEGDRVKAGELLGTIDGAVEEQARQARELEAQAAEVQASLVKKGVRGEEIAVTRARLRGARAAEDLLRKQIERERELHRRGVTPEARLEEMEGQLTHAVAEREVLENVLSEQQRGARPEERDMASVRAAAARAGVTLDDLRLERRELRAPVDGVVLDVHSEVGEVVSPGTPVVTMADPDRIHADVFVPEGRLPGIDVGDRARLRADGIATALTGHVEHVARRTEFTPRYLFSDRERSNLVVRVKVRVDDPRGLLHAGVPVFVTLDRNTPEGEQRRLLELAGNEPAIIAPKDDAVPASSASTAVTSTVRGAAPSARPPLGSTPKNDATPGVR
jgi:HlyD family secretion protein